MKGNVVVVVVVGIGSSMGMMAMVPEGVRGIMIRNSIPVSMTLALCNGGTGRW